MSSTPCRRGAVVYTGVPTIMLHGFSVLPLRCVLPKQAKCEGRLVKWGGVGGYHFVNFLGVVCSRYVYRANACWLLLNLTPVKFILFTVVTVQSTFIPEYFHLFSLFLLFRIHLLFFCLPNSAKLGGT